MAKTDDPQTPASSSASPLSDGELNEEILRNAGTDSAQSFANPVLSGRYVYLRPIVQSDYHFLRLMDLSTELGPRWRFRGATPTPEAWAQTNKSALAQFLVVKSEGGQPQGIVGVYNESFQDQYAYLALAAFAPARRSPLVMLGAALFVEYVFTCWPFRKLYLDSPEYNLSHFASGLGNLLVEEGRLRQHTYYDGQFWDTCILALYRDTWRLRAPRLLAAAGHPKQPVVEISLPEGS